MGSPSPVDILLVEDNPNDEELTLRALKKISVTNLIHVARDGVEALDFMFARGSHADRAGMRPVRVVLLDIKLPKLNGLEVLKEIKSDARLCRIPVIMLTSSREEPDVKEAYRLGANSYVVKPVEFDDFVRAVSQLGLYWILLNEYPI